jgi:uncharacterized protein
METKALVEQNNLYPIFLKLETLHTLVVGGGNVGLEKAEALHFSAPDAKVTIVAPLVKEELKTLVANTNNYRIIEREFEEEDLQGKDLIILATDNKELHKYVKQLAKEKGILCNVADTPDLCDFYLGSVVKKGNLKIAISTNGKSPTIAKRLKETFNELLPNEMDAVLDNMQSIRNKMSGDFNAKIKKLNAITNVMVEDDSTEKDKKRKRIAKYLVSGFLLMLIGHFILSYLPLQQMGKDIWSYTQGLDKAFPLMVLAGVIAQLIDGTLGMGYGVTSATILSSVVSGPLATPAAISSSIHTAEIVATGVSGYSHFKFGNVNKKLFKALVIPGVLGAVLGAALISLVDEKMTQYYVKPFIVAYTLFLGFKFIWNAFREQQPRKKYKRYKLLAAFGGFFDSVGGGGWGPIVTSTLINNGRSHKYVIGSVSLTEFFVTLSSAFAFFLTAGISHWQMIFALMLGSVIAAPFAAKLAGKIPKKTSYILLGVLVIFWSCKNLIKYI